MTNMMQRMGEIGGFFTVVSQPGSGCRVEFTVPLNHSPYPMWFARRRRLHVEIEGAPPPAVVPSPDSANS